MKTLSDLCKPRASVFDKVRLDTVYNLDDLPTILPDEFFLRTTLPKVCVFS